MMLLCMIVDSLPAGRGSVVNNWSPPMTASGRHVKVAHELERTLRGVWKELDSDPRPGYRPPRSRFQAALRRIMESDDALELFPEGAREQLLRARVLLERVVEEGLA